MSEPTLLELMYEGYFDEYNQRDELIDAFIEDLEMAKEIIEDMYGERFTSLARRVDADIEKLKGLLND